MRLLDLVRLIADNLARRKTRVALTAIGVVIGTAAVVVLVSLGIGLQRNATEQLGGISDLTLIQVYPQYGEEFYGGGGGPGYSVSVMKEGPAQTSLITPQTLEDLAALDGVAAVFPRDYLNVESVFTIGQLEGRMGIIGVPPDYLETLGIPLQEGELGLTKGTMVVGATEWGRSSERPWRRRPSSPSSALARPPAVGCPAFRGSQAGRR